MNVWSYQDKSEIPRRPFFLRKILNNFWSIFWEICKSMNLQLSFLTLTALLFQVFCSLLWPLLCDIWTACGGNLVSIFACGGNLVARCSSLPLSAVDMQLRFKYSQKCTYKFKWKYKYESKFKYNVAMVMAWYW